MVNSTGKAKNLGWFDVAWHRVKASVPIIGKERAREATTRKSHLK